MELRKTRRALRLAMVADRPSPQHELWMLQERLERLRTTQHDADGAEAVQVVARSLRRLIEEGYRVERTRRHQELVEAFEAALAAAERRPLA